MDIPQALVEPNRVGVGVEDLELYALQLWLVPGPMVKPLNQLGAVPLPPRLLQQADAQAGTAKQRIPRGQRSFCEGILPHGNIILVKMQKFQMRISSCH